MDESKCHLLWEACLSPGHLSASSGSAVHVAFGCIGNTVHRAGVVALIKLLLEMATLYTGVLEFSLTHAVSDPAPFQHTWRRQRVVPVTHTGDPGGISGF